MKNKNKYKYVDYLWDDKKAKNLEDDQLALFLYRSNLLGSDLRITNFGGGNTSCKTIEKDPVSNQDVEVMWIKGSGGDIGTLKRGGIAGLYNQKLHDLKKVYRGLEYEDEMVTLLNHCIYDLDSRAPSIDTPLHGLLPFKHIDHLHPDSLIAIAAAEESKKITKEIWGDTMGWLPWKRPGFDLALQMEACLNENPKIRGIVLGNHGVFTWGETSYESYVNSLEVIETASQYIEDKINKKGSVFGGQKIKSLSSIKRKGKAEQIAPILRGLCSSEISMIGHINDDKKVLEFINSCDFERLAPMGTSCPDHFLRTKIKPLTLSLKPDENLSDSQKILDKISNSFEKYRKEYQDYYNKYMHPNSPAIRDANPVVILYPGIGMFTFAKNKQTARVSSEFYVNAINVMRGAEAISRYTSLPLQEAFDIEYWLLEEAKLKRQPTEKPLSRRVALVTGSGGGIGRAIANKLIFEGANVVFADISKDYLNEAIKNYSTDQAIACHCDVTHKKSLESVIKKTCIQFGGLDIVVHSAGLAISKPLVKTTEEEWDLLQDVLVKGQFMLAKLSAKIMKKQKKGGNIINIVSKNGLVSGPNNSGYGTAKAAQMHMSRLLATELASDQIRVNTINPDGVIQGSKIWEGEWAEGRAKAYGISVKELPAFYAKRNLLNKVIRPNDIANAVFALLAILDKSTGNIINVDGGVPDAFVR